MGKFSDGVQTVQLAEGGSNSRGSGYAATLSRLIEGYLSEIYIREDVVIHDDRELAHWGVDPEIFNLVYDEWSHITVSESGVLIRFASV